MRQIAENTGHARQTAEAQQKSIEKMLQTAEANTQLLEANQKILLAQMLQQAPQYTRGQMPVFADHRGQYHAAKEVLARHQLLSPDETWSQGPTGLALRRVQD